MTKDSGHFFAAGRRKDGFWEIFDGLKSKIKRISTKKCHNVQFVTYVVKSHSLEGHEMFAETFDQEFGTTATTNDYFDHNDHDETVNTDPITTFPITGETPTVAELEDTLQHSSVLYVVEKIVGEKIMKRKKHYCVKWDGYSSSENTWEPAQKLKNNQVLLQYLADKRKQKT